MALKVIDIRENWTISPQSDGDGEPSRVGLVVRLDLDNDGRRIHDARLDFADYAGLETEWDAGAATTVLDSAVDTYETALSDTEALSSAQKSYLLTTKVWP